MRATLPALALVAATLLAGCSETDSSSPEPDAPPAEETTAVPWENYAPGLQDRIDELAAARDCDGLQREFDTADANSDAQASRTGEGNADLLEYVDAAMRGAGCY